MKDEMRRRRQQEDEGSEDLSTTARIRGKVSGRAVKGEWWKVIECEQGMVRKVVGMSDAREGKQEDAKDSNAVSYLHHQLSERNFICRFSLVQFKLPRRRRRATERWTL